MSKNKRFVRNENNMLLGIIGDEETVTGFLLAGIGERSESSTNFLKVNSTTTNDQIEEFFHSFNQLINSFFSIVVSVNLKKISISTYLPMPE